MPRQRPTDKERSKALQSCWPPFVASDWKNHTRSASFPGPLARMISSFVMAF
jgi:hypothetical protein